MAYRGNIVHLNNLVEKIDGQIFLVVGPPGTGKKEFAIQYLMDGLESNHNSAFLTTDSFPTEIIEKMKDLGTNPTPFIENKKLQFIDAFSYRTGSPAAKDTLAVDNIRDLTELSIIIKQLKDNNENLQFVINTISTLAIFNRSIALLDFIQSQIARLKQKKHGAIIIAHEGMIDQKVIQGIQAFVDGVISFKLEEDENGVLNPMLRVEYASAIKRAGWLSLYR